MSVKDNVRDTSDGQCDFEKVNGMDGIYIASTYDPSRAERYKSLISGTSDDDIQVEKKKNKRPERIGEDLKDFTDSLSEFKKTKITFDKGGIWKPLSPPIKDQSGKKY